MELPVVHVDQLWHQRHSARPAHAWLRRAVAAAARSAFDERLAGAASVLPAAGEDRAGGPPPAQAGFVW
jgi:hypothetical protein